MILSRYISHYRATMKLALPVALSQLGYIVVQFADNAMVGAYGGNDPLPLSAVSFGVMISFVMFSLCLGITLGLTPIVGEHFARGEYRRTAQYLQCSIVSYTLFGVVFMILQLLSVPLLYKLGQPVEVVDMAVPYYELMAYSLPAIMLYGCFKQFLEGMGDTTTPMVIAIFQNILNILLSLLFVYSFGMEIRGVALGTLLAQWGGLVLAVVLCWYNYGRLWSSKVWDGLWRRDRLAALFSVNRDIFLRTLCMIVVHFFFVSAGARLGNVELAVNTLLMQFFTLFSYFMDGFAFAGEALTGKAIGGGNKMELRSTVHNLFVWGVLISVSFTVIYAVAGTSLLSLLTDNASVADSAMHYRHWTLLFPLCGMAAFVWDGIYIGATKTRPMFFSTLGGMIMFITLFFLLSPSLGNHGLWIAYLAYLALRGVVLTITSKTPYAF